MASAARREGQAGPSVALRAALYAASLVMLALSFPVFDAWPLAYVCLVPWLLATEKSSLRWTALCSWLMGLVFFGVEVAWLRFVTIPGWVSLTGFLSLYFLAFGALVHVLRSRWRVGFFVIVPIVWVALEYVRSFVLGGFSWYYLGHSQYRNLAMIQVADLAGVYGISFVLALVNGATADAVSALRGEGPLKKRLLKSAPAVVTAAAAVLAMWGYGKFRLNQYEPVIGPRISTIQGSIPQHLKDDENSAQDVFGKYMSISEKAVGQGAEMLVWPETMVPGFLNFAMEDRWRRYPTTGKRIEESQGFVQGLKDLAVRAKARVLAGGQYFDMAYEIVTLDDGTTCRGKVVELTQEAVKVETRSHEVRTFPRDDVKSIQVEPKRFNSAYYIDAERLDNRHEFMGRYDKIELVPFGEYTPLKRYFPFLAKMVPYEVGFEPGRKPEVFDLNGTKFGVLICYEDTIPRLVRRFRLAGAQFLVNISNDGWFEGSAELDEHLAICAFRAVENRVGIVRSVNTGISAFISPTGRIEDVVKDGRGRRKLVEGVLTRNVKCDRRETLYTRCGDWLGRLCLGAMLFFAALAVVQDRRARRKAASQAPSAPPPAGKGSRGRNAGRPGKRI